MSKERYSATKLRANLYRVLDRVLATGVPVEIERGGKLLRIVLAEPADKLKRLRSHPEYLACDPEEIVHLDWYSEWKP